MAVTEADVLDALISADADAMSTTEIAVAVNISHPGAWRRLEKLAEAGFVERTTNQESMTDWWSVTEEGLEALEE